MKTLSAIGLHSKLQKDLQQKQINTEEVARVIAVHKERYLIRNHKQTFQAEITGNMRYAASTSHDFPAVGDWVRMLPMDENSAIIIEIFQRISILQRQTVGKQAANQLIACNVDFAFLTMAVDRDFNLNRLDRYVSICKAGNIEPIMIMSKCDLISEEQSIQYKNQIQKRYPQFSIYQLSYNDSDSLENFQKHMQAEKTYCFVGSSGVGKSSLVNYLLQNDEMKTSTLSSSNYKGRHTTTHRELFLLPNGSIVIDTPGMRELGITEQSDALDLTFDKISTLSVQCRYADCTHTCEKGCAVLHALQVEEIDQSEYDSYQKLKREQEHYAQSRAERRQKGKNFSREIKKVKEQRKRNKF